MKRIGILFIVFLFFHRPCLGQKGKTESLFSRADSLLGSPNPRRAYNVLKYAIVVRPDFQTRSITGKNTITYQDSGLIFMQIDLQKPLEIDSILQSGRKLAFTRDGNVFLAYVGDSLNKKQPCYNCPRQMIIYYHGKPHIAVKPPWDGGWVFTKDDLGRPWMTVACEEQGASIWYPCKDYLGDEPDSGASLAITVQDSLVAVGNGRLKEKRANGDGTTTWEWEVKSPINNYDIIPYIGKYVRWHSFFPGEKGNLDCDFWVLDYQLQQAKKHFSVVDSMLTCFEFWFGPYPFYEDGYKLVESPHLGMEHQSAIAYGNQYRQGYSGRDLSRTGWGLKWDFIVVHESGHEWFGNNITAKDLADEWIHESFTNYSETLYTGYYFGKPAGEAYNLGLRKNIANKFPIILHYGVHQGPLDTDEYYKGSNMINTIRQVIADDSLFRKILRGLNQTFYHQTVTSKDIESYINRISGRNFTPVFNQYLRSTDIPVFEYSLRGDQLSYRWTNCLADFNLPLLVDIGGRRWLNPTTAWQELVLKNNGNNRLTADPNFYVDVKKVSRTEPNP